MRPMRRHAAWLSAVLILALQVGPLLHLVTHRNDHTHGPVPARTALHVPGDRSQPASSRRADLDGPARRPALQDAHAEAHAHGLRHRHDAPADTPEPRASVSAHAAYGYAAPGVVRRMLTGLATALTGALDAAPEPLPPLFGHPHESAPEDNHGDGSAAHFGLALTEAPLPDAVLPSTAFTLATLPAPIVLLRSRPVLRRLPRGPPPPLTPNLVC